MLDSYGVYAASSTANLPHVKQHMLRHKCRMADAIDTLILRIDRRLKDLGLSEREVSMTATDKPDAIRYIRVRRSMPSADRLDKIAAALETTSDWLMGKLKTASSEVAPAIERSTDDDTADVQEMDLAYGMGGGTFLDVPVKSTPLTFSRKWLRMFTEAPPEKIFVARGMGDSMMPTILDADIVLIDTSDNRVMAGDKIWAVTYGQTGLIKRLRPMPDGSVKILSDNPSVPPETAYDGELNVVGRVVAIVRKT